MKITFLTPPPLDGNPPAERIFGCNYGLYSQPNIFILYPATMLKNAGYIVDVKDFTSDNNSKKELIGFLKKDDSYAYVIYTVFLSKKTDIITKELIRKYGGNKKIVYIGTEPTANPKDFVDNEDVFVIRGESEESIIELFNVLSSKKNIKNINGVSFFNKKLINNPSRPPIENLDKIPIPDRTLLNRNKYHNPKFPAPSTTMLTSRGCFGRCIYCVPNSQSFAREIEFKKNNECKPPVRIRSAENVIKELEILKKEGYKSIYFVDDQFVWEEKRMIKIAKSLKKYKFRWGALARAGLLLNEKIIKSFSESGCEFIDVGIESFDQKILDYIKKDEKVETYYKAVKLLKKYGIEPELNVLLGASPLETKETIKKTLREVKKLDCRYVLISICTPFPHTEFNKLAKKHKWMTGKEYQPLDPIRKSQISYPHLKKDELEKMMRNAYKSFYFRPKFMAIELLKVRSFKDIIGKLKVALKIAKM